MNITLAALTPLLPMGILLATAILLLMFEVFSSHGDRTYSAHVAVTGCVIAGYLLLDGIDAPSRALFGTSGRAAPLVVDAFARLASAVMIAGALIACLLSPGYVRNAKCEHGEYYALILFSVVGMMVMAMAGDLFTMFLGLETMSIAVYALTGSRRNDARASEAALKYFLMGAFATGFLLFGIAMIYGVTGSTALIDLARALTVGDVLRTSPLLSLGLVLVLIGFAFKVAAFPFHMWAPDVYEGAPTPVAGFMAVGVKAAAFVALLRIVVTGLGKASEIDHAFWIPLLSWLAIGTVVVGNVLALVQQNVKRMLAYSSIAHAGYALIGVVAAARGEPSAASAVLFFLTGYTFMTLGAFGVLTFLERREGGLSADRYGAFAGIGTKHPALSLAMGIFMIALAGIPPTAGFFGKLYLFSAALRAHETGLALVGILGSVISVYYYLRVIVAFYMRDVPDAGPLPTATRSPQLALGLVIAVAGVFYLGLFPGPWIELGRAAALALAG